MGWAYANRKRFGNYVTNNSPGTQGAVDDEETQILTLVRPGELSLSNQIGMKKARLDEIAQDLIAEIDTLFLTEVNLE